MKNTKRLVKAGKAGLALAILTGGALIAPATYADDIRVGVNIPVPAPTVTVAPDNYVYYPAYGSYYSPKRHRFAFIRGNSWVWDASPPGASATVVLGSPSVNMDWHDAPWNHHRDVVKTYPKDWRPEHMDRHDHDRR